MSPKKDKSAKNGFSKEVPGIFSDIKIDVNALDGHYNKGAIASDTYRPYTIFGEFLYLRRTARVSDLIALSVEVVVVAELENSLGTRRTLCNYLVSCD